MEQIKFLAGIPNKPVVFLISSGKLDNQVELAEMIYNLIKESEIYRGKRISVDSLDSFIENSNKKFIFPDFTVLFGWNLTSQYEKIREIDSLNIIKIRVDSDNLSRFMESDLPIAIYPSIEDGILLVSDDAKKFYDFIFYKQNKYEDLVENVVLALLKGEENGDSN